MSSAISGNRNALFVFYDNGGIAPFTEVVKKLPEMGITPYTLAMATAAERAEGLGFDKKQIIYLKDAGVQTDVSATGWPRARKLPDNEVALVVKKVKELNPELILTGTHSYVQFQLVEAIANACDLQDKKLAYYDTLHTLFERHPDGLMTLFSHNNYHLLVPNVPIARAISETKVTVVGSSGLENDVRKIIAAQKDRAEILRKIGFSEEHKKAVYIGGYADGYEDSVCLFLDIVTWLRANGEPDLQVAIAIHPKFAKVPIEGAIEYQLVQKRKVPDIKFPVGIATTHELIAISDFAPSCFSLLVPAALAAGVPSAFINAHPEKLAGNVLIEEGLCKNLQTPEEVKAALDEKLPEKNFFERIGMPGDGATNLANAVKEAIDAMTV